MDFKFSKNAGDSQQESPDEKKKQGPLLVLLLILVGGFAYLYFFTDLIRPQETQQQAEAPAPAPQVVKMPLPSREDEPAKPAGTAPEKAEALNAAATVPVTAEAPAAKPAAAPVKQTPAPAVKAAPSPAPSKLKEEPKKAAAVKTADNKAQPAPLAAIKGDKAAASGNDGKKPAAAAKKTAVAGKKIAAVKKDDGMKPVSGDQSAAIAKKAAKDSSMLLIGDYVLEEALSADMGRVRKAGFKPVVKPSAHKRKSMNRLFVSDFIDRASARSTLEKLKGYTSDAFIIDQGGRFSVYAGSYLQIESANAEKERLKGAGFLTTVRHTSIAIPSQSLSVGPFKSRKEADAALARLKSSGIKAAFVQK